MGQRIEQCHGQLLAEQEQLAIEAERVERNLLFVKSLKQTDAILEETLSYLRNCPHPLVSRFIEAFTIVEECIDNFTNDPESYYCLKEGIDEMVSYLARFNASCREATKPLGFWDKIMQQTTQKKMEKVIESYLDNDALAAFGAWALVVYLPKANQQEA